MADDMVLRAQRFVNETYGDRIGMTVTEDGVTGWNTMYALTRALQYELGISALSNNFGPTTLSVLGSKYPTLNASTVPSADFCRIIQSGLYCKGYDGGEIDGIYNSRVEAAMAKLKANMGVDAAFPGSDLTPKVFKGLLNMDAYVTVNSGSETIRSIQQWLNGQYVGRQDFFIIPCDGHHSRDVAKSMLFAVQYALGMADGVANGVFGPGTRAGLKEHTVSTGSAGVWVQLFSAAMVLNQWPVAFTGSYTSALATAVGDFQSFAALPVTGKGDFSTWASLLVSYGDQERSGAACDGVTMITDARARSLKAAGITYVGRYLINPSTKSLPEKEIQPGELQTIADNGLRCFPIYQTYGRDASGFSYAAGRSDAQAAVNAALDHGFKSGTRIFFAVDFDALDYQVTDDVLPHFKGIQDAIADDGNRYRIGVYGPRNVCTRVAEAGHSTASFVSDMSSGFSGNFGYPLPPDWAYDQIVTRDIGSGDGALNIDIDVASGRDTGQGSFDAPRTLKADTLLSAGVVSSMQTDVGTYMESIGFPLDGGTKTYQHWKCFQSTVVDHDELITELSQRYNMRKALIQASAYWEMRHIGIEDESKDALVITTYNTTGKFIESSTGIGQCRGITAAWAWNYCISRGYTTGSVTDPGSDDALYSIWKKLYDDEEFDLRTVCMVHLWDSEGKPGGDHDEDPLRSMRLDYTQSEIFEILRRYQGFGDQAESDNVYRMGLYQIMEKYNSISRNS
ncbi:glycoside hydrolase domain-containing protein [Streptomyces sp. NPDC101225]|uniref:glycoside hydrolase domain-containing protein n=1 Tax=Streptomyces sp. NPDC101225 TaxID=3366135 RepID=UPI0037FC1E38